MPEGATPPRSVPPEFSFEKELITAGEMEELKSEKKIPTRYRTLFWRADLSPATQELIKDWARWRIYPITLKDNRRTLHDHRDRLMRDIREAGRLVKTDPQLVRRFREALLKEVQARAVELLAPDMNFHVRLQGVLILGGLTLMEEDSSNNIREEAYTPAAEPLRTVITDPNPHEAFQGLKIAACRGLTRILLIGTLRSDAQKTQIARDLIAQLNDPSSHVWYQSRLCETLGAINLEISADNRREPLILDSLSRVAADKQRDLCVR
ncbi:MAG TPA: hypothetical protein VML55_14065, partial [Planctomycetaceae bacterium]|nr:hypothetical protein [Planctomycetaceae bacterium]